MRKVRSPCQRRRRCLSARACFSPLFLFLGLLAILSAFAAPARAATINVPADKPTIAAALIAAANGDTIIVADGTYLEHSLSTADKAVTLESANGPAHCIIDAQQKGSVFYLHSHEKSTTFIQGFTIQDGSGTYDNEGESYYGGGMYVSSSAPTITDCMFTNNSLSRMGGIHCHGGGLYLVLSSPVITDCIFTNNSADEYGVGGGLAVESSSPTITDCTFTHNSTPGGYGGGVDVDVAPSTGGIESSPTFTNCTFANNSAGSNGYVGGIYLFVNTCTITDCTFTQNSASQSYAGALFLQGGSVTITDSILWGDSSPEV